MQHFISFQKKKAFYLSPSTQQNSSLAHEINHELMNIGYILTKEAFDVLSTQSEETLSSIYSDLLKGINLIVGGGGYEPIYRNFPQSVLAMSYEEFIINAIIHYWSWGQWRPEDAEYINREFKMEPVDYKPVSILSEAKFNAIFTNILYSGSSISTFDKECIDWYLERDGEFDFRKIKFNETLAYVGKSLLYNPNLQKIPTRNATTLLRIWAAYSDGDEGLKEPTRFKNPNKTQRQLLMQTLESCFNLEDSFKTYREPWLRVLFYLHPQTKTNQARYPKLAKHTNLLRNEPKKLRTFNAKVEMAIKNEDEVIFTLLEKRAGIFMRRLDHLVRIFGLRAIKEWLKLNPSLEKLINIYNHFSSRDVQQTGRGAVLASQAKSELVTYDAQEALSTKLVQEITSLVRNEIERFKSSELKGKKIWVHRALYYSPLAVNNRASSLSLTTQAIGTVYQYEKEETLRLYVHWEGKSDIDLSGFAISKKNDVIKVGWNANHKQGSWIVYSGDNTGYAAKNAEYLDINTKSIPEDIEWIIVEARIFRGPKNFAGYKGKAKIGWMSRKHPQAGIHWQPKTLQHAMVLQNKAKTAYLMAYHPNTNSIVYLDMSMGSARVSNANDAIKMRIFLENFVTLDAGEEEIDWKKLNQGHILHLLAEEVVSEKESADIIFDENTISEEITRLMQEIE